MCVGGVCSNPGPLGIARVIWAEGGRCEGLRCDLVAVSLPSPSTPTYTPVQSPSPPSSYFHSTNELHPLPHILLYCSALEAPPPPSSA